MLLLTKQYEIGESAPQILSVKNVVAGCHAATVYGSGPVRRTQDDEQAIVSQKWLRWSVLTFFLREIGRNRFCK